MKISRKNHAQIQTRLARMQAYAADPSKSEKTKRQRLTLEIKNCLPYLSTDADRLYFATAHADFNQEQANFPKIVQRLISYCDKAAIYG